MKIDGLSVLDRNHQSMKKLNHTGHSSERDTMRPEYDFSGAARRQLTAGDKPATKSPRRRPRKS